MSDQLNAFLGINIGGTECSIVLGTREGTFLDRSEWKTSGAPDPESCMAQIDGASRPWRERYEIQGIGVAIGGPLDTGKGIILGPPNLPGWDRVPLQDALQSRFGIPVKVAHDAAACALAESRFGPHGVEASLVYLTCGTGFGAGVLQAGKILEGSNGVHPEVGHWRLTEGGPEAFGRAGSAEAYCSGKGFSRIASWKYPDRWGSSIPEPEQVTRWARDGDEQAGEVVAFQAKMTGRVCAMVAELLCPDKILLGSLARHLGSFWVEPVVKAYREEVFDRIGESVRVEPASLGDRLQDLSALAVGMEGAHR